ncbi:MAG: M61 family metallopeptidase [Microscillaceae bacterium]|nr:M61 family metallopeptidase [Microscillaceae bacterium]
MVEAATQIFGKNPLSDYHILVQMTDQQRGGLEHLNSTALQYTRTGLETPEGYEDFLSLVAHEYFHIWNVKRLRPAPLGPFDYERENYTTLLWQAEGFTSYYEKLILKKAGLISQEAYLDSLSKKINQIESQPGQALQSLAESSWDAWIKAYRPDENSANATISYYTKGAVVAMLLDLLLIAQTEGEACLDEVMQDLYARYYEQANRGFSEDELKAALEGRAQISLEDFFAHYIHQTQALPYEAYFDKLGIDFLWETASSDKPYWGMAVEGKIIRQVWEGGPAHRDGLSAFDQIVAINGIFPPSLSNWLEKQKTGARYEYTVLREGLLKTVFVSLDQTPPPLCQIKPRPEASTIQKRMQARFFGNKVKRILLDCKEGFWNTLARKTA